MKKWLLIFSIVLGGVINCLADSPLTSTVFYPAYMDVPIVKETVENKGQFTDKVKEFLYESSNPVDQKLALINALGWDFDGNSNFDNYISHCLRMMDGNTGSEIEVVEVEDVEIVGIDSVEVVEVIGAESDEENSLDYFVELVVRNASSEQLAVLIYLSAMSDYFDMSTPYKIAQYTYNYPSSNQAYILPIALMLSQISLDERDWCNVYKAVKDLVLDAPVKDMRPEAINMIMDYIGIYQKYCE